MVSILRRTGIQTPSLGWDRGVSVLLLTFVICLPLLSPRIYAVDSVQYYAYLRSIVLDGDLDFTNEYTYFDQANPHAGIAGALLHKTDPITGQPINVAPIGTAILWSPAFLIAHGGVLLGRALGSTVPANGYSAPYIWAITIATALYGLGGLLLAYQLARRYTGVWAATVAVIVCWLASPIIFFMYISPPWSHVPSLFMTSAFITYWVWTREHRTTIQWLILGALGGLMTLCREQLGIFMLLPALEAVGNYWRTARQRQWTAFWRLLSHHLLFLAVVAVSLIPQFLVYRVLNGRWGPSSHVSGKLRWDSPHFFDTLIDPAHGAFMWTPIWLVGLAGLVLLWRRDRGLTLLLGAALFAQVYINGAFVPTWHLSGSFGFRRLIETTPIFILGVALLLDRIRWPRFLIVGLSALLIAWNVGLLAQWSLPPRPIRDGLVWEGMLTRQLAIPVEGWQKLPSLLFERCKYVENDAC
jgi:hypothetical protein